MSRNEVDTLKDMVRANDKLLKALITLLALRDEDLLDDLKAIFAMAHAEGSDLGSGAPATWKHVLAELKIMSDLVDGEQEEDDVDGPSYPRSRM